MVVKLTHKSGVGSRT